MKTGVAPRAHGMFTSAPRATSVSIALWRAGPRRAAIVSGVDSVFPAWMSAFPYRTRASMASLLPFHVAACNTVWPFASVAFASHPGSEAMYLIAGRFSRITAIWSAVEPHSGRARFKSAPASTSLRITGMGAPAQAHTVARMGVRPSSDRALGEALRRSADSTPAMSPVEHARKSRSVAITSLLDMSAAPPRRPSARELVHGSGASRRLSGRGASSVRVGSVTSAVRSGSVVGTSGEMGSVTEA